MRRKGLACCALFCFIMAGLLTGCGDAEREKITSVEDLNSPDIKIGVATGSATGFVAMEALPDAKIENFNIIPDGCAAVIAGKIDGFVFDKLSLEYLALHNPETVVIDESLGDYISISVGMRLDDTELCEDINAVIARMRADGTLADMEQRWMKSMNHEMPELQAPENPQGTLRIMSEGLIEPFSYVGDGGALVGFDVEFGMRLAYALNMDVSIQSLSFSALIPALEAGKCDVVISELDKTPERAERILFSDPYLETETGILVLADRYEKNVTSVSMSAEEVEESLENAKVGAMVGTRGAAYIEETYPKAELVQFDTTNDAVAALQNGKVQYVVCGMSRALNYVNANEEIVYVDYPLTDEGLAFGVAKGNDELRDRISECVKRYRESGLLDEMKERWFNETPGEYELPELPVREDGEILRVALAATAEPLCFIYNNEIAGFDCELIERIAYELGMKVEYQDMAFSAEVAALQSGKADVALSLVPTEERKKYVDFTEIYFDNPQTLLTLYTESKNKLGFSERVSAFVQGLREKFIGTFITEQRWKLVLNGLATTIIIAVAAFAMATVWGGVLLGMERSKVRFFRGFAAVYGRIISGTPMLVVLMILYYIVFKGVDIPGIIVSIMGFGLYSGAGLAEVFKTGIDSVDKGQKEAAAALGFKSFDIFRKIVFPQAVRHIFGLYKGQFVALVKSTSIVGYIAIQDLTKVSDIIRSRTYDAFFPLIATAVIYFLVIYIFVALFSGVENRIDPKKRARVLKGVDCR